jgi:hypothetical protein
MRLLGVLPLALALAACAEVPMRTEAAAAQAQEQCAAAQVEQTAAVNRRHAEMLLAMSYLQESMGEQGRTLAELRSGVASLQTSMEAQSGDAALPPAQDCQALISEMQQQLPVSTKLVVGAVEHVFLPNLGIELPARIDTGAATASLDAQNIQTFERDGNRWVRFTLTNPETGEVKEIERLRSRRARIVQSNTEEAERRPVVELLITIGSVTQLAEFTLSDRTHLTYPVLIGRNILQDVMVVDVSQEDIAPYERPAEPAVPSDGAQD